MHGIGVQRRGETLAELGRPVLRWFEEWCAGLHDRRVGAGISAEELRALSTTLEEREAAGVGDREATTWALEAVQRLVDDLAEQDSSSPENSRMAARRKAAQVTLGTTLAAGVALADARRETPDDPAAPAHAELVLRRLDLDGSLAEERWLLAESWWAESFWPPRFSDLARWGAGVVPWTIGSHYGTAVRRVWAEREQAGGTGHRLAWCGRLGLSLLRLLGSLLLGLVALGVLALLLVVAALPIPRLRAALGALQRQIAASLGDSYILLARPIEAASIVGQVRRDLAWLAEPARCAEVAVVAHSQGAAVTHEALRAGHPANLRLLLTLGSGLRKLEELRQLRGRGGHLRLAAQMTLGALITGTLSTFVLVRTRVLDPGEWVALAVVTAVFLGLAAAGLWDFVEEMDVGDLRRRVRRFGRSGVRWVDCHAMKDPVPNGPLLDPPERLTAEGGEGAEIPHSVALCNEGSTGADHTAYWRNLDEFVSLVVAELTVPPGGRRSILAPRPVWGDGITVRRRWRVRWLVAVRWVVALSVALAVAYGRSEWRALLGWLAQRIGGWAGGLAGAPGGKTAPLALDVLWPTLGVLIAVLLAAGTVRTYWRNWDATEMRTAIRGGPVKKDPIASFAFVFGGQMVLACWLLSRLGAPEWLSAAFIVGGILLLALLNLGQISFSPPALLLGRGRRTSHAERAHWVVNRLVTLFCLLVLLLGAIQWVQRLLGEHVAPERAPDFLLKGLLLFGAIAVVLLIAIARLRRR
ncbi:MAG TPA: hypothetical protein VGC93_14790 [Thermoanaerobaculia bacterium]